MTVAVAVDGTTEGTEMSEDTATTPLSAGSRAVRWTSSPALVRCIRFLRCLRWFLPVGRKRSRNSQILLPFAITGMLLAGCGQENGRTGTGGLADALGGPADAGFARATGIREFSFPRDHGPHPEYRNEWWYVTGNLDDEAGRRYGFQLTLFRIGLAPGRSERPSNWATNQVWMAHLALTDVAGEEFHAAERFARGGDIALAGATQGPVSVWLEDWRLARDDDDGWRIEAKTDAFDLDLQLDPRKPPVLQGDRGLSRKSEAAGNASHYYSLTRLAADGRVSLNGEWRPVDGLAWMDREWSTSALGEHQVGWDWFALQLDDGRDLMYYRLRRDDGSVDPLSAGSLVAADGAKRPLAHDEVSVEVLDRWTSEAGTTYPSRWRIQVHGIEGLLEVVPVMNAQELDVSVRYWEGAVDVLRDGARIGRGYVELAGYANDATPEQPGSP
jgi:predicted secreted hydrolase